MLCRCRHQACSSHRAFPISLSVFQPPEAPKPSCGYSDHLSLLLKAMWQERFLHFFCFSYPNSGFPKRLFEDTCQKPFISMFLRMPLVTVMKSTFKNNNNLSVTTYWFYVEDESTAGVTDLFICRSLFLLRLLHVFA